tara:strand:- start:503 stop:4045 length:3543 start_codon:yes stop_codon:yes gene_type:complete
MLKQLDFSLPDESTYEDMEDDNLSFSLPSDVSYEQTELTSLPSNSDYVDTPDEAGYTEEDLGSYQEDFLEEEEDDISYIKLEPTFELTSLGEDYSVANLAKHKGVVDMVNSYLTKRNGEEGKQQEGESDEDVIEKMLTHFRYVEGNTIDTMQEVDFLKDSKTTKKTKDNFNLLYTMYQEIPNFTSEGGGSFFSGASDVLSAAIFDPAVVVGLGFGGPMGAILTTAVKTAGKGATTRAVLSHALKGNLGKVTAMTSVEGLLGAMGESQRQEMKIEVGMMTEKDYGAIGTMGAVSGVGSLIGFPLGVNAAKKALSSAGVRSGDEVVGERLASLKSRSSKNIDDKDSLANFDPVTGELFDQARANRIRDQLGMPDAPLSLSVMNDVTSVVTQAVGNLMEDMPEVYFRNQVMNKAGTKLVDEPVGDMVLRIMSGADTIDADVLERALGKTGLSIAEFSQLERLTLKESATQMQAYGALAKRIKKMAGNDPALKKKLAELYDNPHDTRSVFGTFTGFMKRLDRESRAMMVSQISTTARNVISAAAYLTFGTASKLIESTMYHTAKAVSATVDGNGSVKGFKSGLAQIGEDAFSTLGQVVMPKQNKELADMMLKNNSRLSNTLFRTMQETGDQDLSRVTKWMNGLNMAQDQVIRSGVFTDSVNQQMKKLDLDMYEYIANNKPIPIQVLKKATDDALEATFAIMPAEGTIANKFVKLVESLPFMPVIGTQQFPFARFMADAMTFQYRYSPLNFLNAASVGTQGVATGRAARKALASGDIDKYRTKEVLKAMKEGTLTPKAKAASDEAATKLAEQSVIQGRKGVQESIERISKGTVGSAALYAAYLYRDENQDTAWYNMIDTSENNKPVDIRAIFPMAPYLAVADLLVKWRNGELDSANPAEQLLVGIAGTQIRPSRTQDFVSDLFEQIAGMNEDGDVVSREKLGKVLGDWAGSIAGRPFTAAQISRDVYSAFDDSEAIVRETRMVKGDGFQEVFSNSFMNHLKSKIPVWQKDLPEFRSPTSEGPVRRQSAAMSQFSGVKYMPAPNEIEAELAKQGIETYTLNPKTGNKQADYYTKKHMPPYINMMLGYTIGSVSYKSQPKWRQKGIIQSIVRQATKVAKEVGEGEALMDALRNGESVSVFDKGRWAKTPAQNRRLADDYFRKYYGKSVAELGAYAAGIKIGAALRGT